MHFDHETSRSLRAMLTATVLFAAIAMLASSASGQAPAGPPRCAYIDLGEWLYAEPHLRCSEMHLACRPGQSFGCFKRRLILRDGLIRRSGEPDRRATAEPFGYIDQFNIHWDVPAGYETDGATIPAAFKPIVGGSWDERYLRAAVLHDFYIRRRTADPEIVHRLFFHALLASDVEPDRAKLLYWAVRNFGPRWKFIDFAAYERERQANLEQIRRDNEKFRAEYSACLDRHLQRLRERAPEQTWQGCPLDGTHQFILDFVTTMRDVIERSAWSVLDDLKAGRCVEVAPDKFDCP